MRHSDIDAAFVSVRNYACVCVCLSFSLFLFISFSSYSVVMRAHRLVYIRILNQIFTTRMIDYGK